MPNHRPERNRANDIAFLVRGLCWLDSQERLFARFRTVYTSQLSVTSRRRSDDESTPRAVEPLHASFANETLPRSTVNKHVALTTPVRDLFTLSSSSLALLLGIDVEFLWHDHQGCVVLQMGISSDFAVVLQMPRKLRKNIRSKPAYSLQRGYLLTTIVVLPRRAVLHPFS